MVVINDGDVSGTAAVPIGNGRRLYVVNTHDHFRVKILLHFKRFLPFQSPLSSPS